MALTPALALAATLALAACGSPERSAPLQPAELPVPSAHVHAVARDPGSGDLLLATHEGLFRYAGKSPRLVGPPADLMGFTVAGPGHYFASGHPGPGTDLPQPLGLVESTDGGRTWRVLSRGGESDFHALTAVQGGLVGFDGTLRVSGDGRHWESGGLASPPRALAAAPDGATVVATTAEGLMRSVDGGRRWQPVPGAPRLLLVDWADGGTLAAVDVEGRLHLSDDAGLTWRRTGQVVPGAEALHAAGAGAGLDVVVAAHDRVVIVAGPGVPGT